MLIPFVLLIALFPDPATPIGEVLRFPTTPSTSDYVLLPSPDFEGMITSFSICSWVRPRHTGSSYAVWFYYNTHSSSSDDEIMLSAFGGYDDLFNSDIGTTNLEKDVWSFYCTTWDLASRTRYVYVNGEQIKTQTTASNRKLNTGGVLVLGNRQTKPGGGFNTACSFGGELYNLHVFDKKLSAEEVETMYKAGRCGEMDKSLNQNIVLGWQDFLDAQRNGAVTVEQGTCSQWQLVRGMVEEKLLEHLMEHHPFNY